VGADSATGLRRQIWIGSIVIRCRHFDEMLAFWQEALGYVTQAPPKDGWVILTDPAGKGPNISLDRVDDGEGEVERLLALGATRYERETSPDDDFVVLVDPDGNRFCVVD
jgi:catechol 2,3-dioxygenase-like lactoylglutathione lyase family enzyme